MGFEIDLEELFGKQKAYATAAEEARESIRTARKSLDRVIESHAMEGEVSTAINGEISNFHEPTFIGLEDALELLESEIKESIDELMNTVGETNERAVIKETALDQADQDLTSLQMQHDSLNQDFDAIYNSIRDLIPLSNPSSVGMNQAIHDAKKDLQDIKDKVAIFEGGVTESPALNHLKGLEIGISSFGHVKAFSYMDPTIQELAKSKEYGLYFKEFRKELDKEKAELQRLKEAMKKEEEEQKEYEEHHVAQVWLRKLSDSIGGWWGDVEKGTRNVKIPVLTDAALEVEGFIGGGGKLISTTAIGAVDGVEFLFELDDWRLDFMYGRKTPDWKLRDIYGAWDHTKSIVGSTVSGLTSLIAEGNKFGTREFKKQENLQNAIWKEPNLKKKSERFFDWAIDRAMLPIRLRLQAREYMNNMDPYKKGEVAFDLLSLVGTGGSGGLLKGTSYTSKLNKALKVGRFADWAKDGMNVAHLAEYGLDTTRLEKLGVEGEVLKKLGEAAKVGDTDSFSKIMMQLEKHHPSVVQRSKIASRELKAGIRKRLLMTDEAFASKIDKLLTRGDDFIKKATSKALDAPIIPTLVKDEYSLSQGVGMLDNLHSGMRLEGRSIRDSVSFITENVDELGQISRRSGPVSVRLGMLSDHVPRIKEIVVKSFKFNDKFDWDEFFRQLGNQEKGLNELTIQEFLDNREYYLKYGRSKEAVLAQRKARDEAYTLKLRELLDEGVNPIEAKMKAKSWLDTQAALHDPDMIAGGFGFNVSGVGDSRINSSIGSQWRSRIKELDEQIRALAKDMSLEERQNTFLNVKIQIE